MTARDDVLQDVIDEVGRAEAKFPDWPSDPHHALAIFQEEVGELTKAVVQATYEPQLAGAEEVRKEGVQAAAMALRFLLGLEGYFYVPAGRIYRGPER